MKVSKKDQHFILDKPQAGFNPDRNRLVVEETIREYEQNRKRRQKNFDDALSERSHAVASYLKSKAVDSSKPIDKYLGKRWLAYLRGQDIVNRLMQIRNPSITKKDVVHAAKTQKRNIYKATASNLQTDL